MPVGKILDELTYSNPAKLSELVSTILNANRYNNWSLPFNESNAKQAVFAFQGDVFSLTVSRKDKWRIFFRSSAEALTAYFFLTAVINMPFANVTALLQILPMTVTLAAAFIFKEKVQNTPC